MSKDSGQLVDRYRTWVDEGEDLRGLISREAIRLLRGPLSDIPVNELARLLGCSHTYVSRLRGGRIVTVVGVELFEKIVSLAEARGEE